MKEKDKKALHDQIVKEVKQDFEERRQKRRPVELAWRLNMNFLMGNQYASITPTGDIDDYGRQYYWQEREVYNHIAPIVETRLAKLTRVKSGVSIRPKTSDECDVQSAKFATAILQSIMEENCFSALLQKANGWAETCGSVFYKIAWNNEKGKKFILDGKPVYDGDVDITVCPPFEIYPENLQIESLQDQPSIIHAKAYSVDDVKRIWGVDVKGEDVNVFTLDKTGVTGGFGYTASVPKIIDEVRHDAVIVIEKYEKPTAKFKDGRLIIVAGDTLLYLGDLPYVNGEGGKRQYPFIKQNSLVFRDFRHRKNYPRPARVQRPEKPQARISEQTFDGRACNRGRQRRYRSAGSRRACTRKNPCLQTGQQSARASEPRQYTARFLSGRKPTA